MSHLHKLWKLHNWRFLHRSTSTGCRKLPKSTTCSTAEVPRPRANPNQDPVAAVVVMAAVVAESTLQTPENPPNQLEKVGRLHYLMIYVGGVENLDTRKSTMQSCRSCLQRLWDQETL